MNLKLKHLKIFGVVVITWFICILSNTNLLTTGIILIVVTVVATFIVNHVTIKRMDNSVRGAVTHTYEFKEGIKVQVTTLYIAHPVNLGVFKEVEEVCETKIVSANTTVFKETSIFEVLQSEGQKINSRRLKLISNEQINIVGEKFALDDENAEFLKVLQDELKKL